MEEKLKSLISEDVFTRISDRVEAIETEGEYTSLLDSLKVSVFSFDIKDAAINFLASKYPQYAGANHSRNAELHAMIDEGSADIDDLG